MTARTRQWIVGLIVVVAVGASADVAVRAAQGTKEIAARWAKGLKPDQRAQAARYIETFRPEYQQALMVTLTDEQRGQFWRERLNAYAGTHKLNAEQASVIKDLISVTHLPAQAQRARIEALGLDKPSRRAALGKDSLLFMGSGWAMHSKTPPTFVPLAARLQQFVADRMIARAETDCTCDWDMGCGIGMKCVRQGDCKNECGGYWDLACYVQGCGWMWMEKCTGICLIVIDPNG